MKRGEWKKDQADRGLYKRGKIWYVRFADERGRVRAERVGPSKGLALKAYQKRKTEVAERRFFPGQRVTLGELIKDALARARQQHELNHPGKRFRTDRHRIVADWFGTRLAAALTPQEIAAKLAEHCQTPATYNRYRVIFTHAYKLGMQNHKVNANPASLVRQQAENNERIRFLEVEEERAVRAAIRRVCPEREPEFDLALHTGMRWSEQYELRWENVDLRRAKIVIPRAKGGQRQWIPINSEARRALDKLRTLGPGSLLVCPNTTPKVHRTWWERCLKEARAHDFRWHDLRHTFASRLVMSGVDILEVNKLLRHKVLQVTMRYAHLAAPHLHAAVERLAGVTKSDTAVPTVPATIN